jgi:stage II sporulation protein D
MGRIIPLILVLLIFIIIILPAALVRGCRHSALHPPPVIDRAPIISPAGEITLRVYRHDLKESAEMALEEYLVGVVAAEMPASFGPEALKAQAVVARTYAVNQMTAFGGSGCLHQPGSDICTAAAHCQAYETEAESLGKWKAAGAAANYNKIREAVRETAGLVITHQGKTIDAVFHSTCGGHTENSEDVWSAALPYLRGVPCAYCDGTRWSETTQVFTSARFAKAVLPYVTAVPVSAGRALLASPERTATGRVLTLRVAGETVRGRDFRLALNLPSTNFTWQLENDKVTFMCRGYGHGVGLCQYGANGLAQSGATFRDIITHYYTGALVTELPPLR